MTMESLQERMIDCLREGGGKKYEQMTEEEIKAVTLSMAEAAQETAEGLVRIGVHYRIAESDAVREQMLNFSL